MSTSARCAIASGRAHRRRHDRRAVDGKEGAAQGAEIDPVIGRGAGVDKAQPDARARLDPHHLRIGEGAVIGEKGVEIDVVQIRLAAEPCRTRPAARR